LTQWKKNEADIFYTRLTVFCFVWSSSLASVSLGLRLRLFLSLVWGHVCTVYLFYAGAGAVVSALLRVLDLLKSLMTMTK